MVEGDVHLVLCDNATLTCEGIFISTGSALTIWRQSGGSGALEALAGNGQYGHGEPGIEVMHGASLMINGGHITAHGTGACAAIGSSCYFDSGEITINNGYVTAVCLHDELGDHSGAAIGSGSNRDAGPITINEGVVWASARNGGAGIGGGYNGLCGPITINGGDIHAEGLRGAGIGNGAFLDLNNPEDARDGTKSGEIRITGGTVYAWSKDGAGIGGGWYVKNGPITITGGVVRTPNRENSYKLDKDYAQSLLDTIGNA